MIVLIEKQSKGRNEWPSLQFWGQKLSNNQQAAIRQEEQTKFLKLHNSTEKEIIHWLLQIKNKVNSAINKSWNKLSSG
jgi:hypothetical protein